MGAQGGDLGGGSRTGRLLPAPLFTRPGVQGEGLGRAAGSGQSHPHVDGAGDVGAVRVPHRPAVHAADVEDVPVHAGAQVRVGHRGQQPRV